MKAIILACLLLSSFAAGAQSRTQLKERVARLARRIDIEVFETNVSNSALRESHEKLRRILATLKGDGGTSPLACINYTLPIYERYYSSSRAVEKAQQTCRKVSDLPVFKFVFEALRTIYTDSSALDRSADKASGFAVEGKLPLLRFAYAKHERQYTKSSAMDKAIANIKILVVDSLECLETFYPTHSRRYSSSSAMDRTAQTCSNQ
ncbi:hypothetical protein A9Q84_17540 [Halobacteriovorax marinus]|uniref:Secreted protein n=1 Tax=Halobacteriovorax marinus TaxID=97084 RepID=A0A1Y5F365_9BACT|nr:hypothetical protein A9Q84_17540 [Halobacteriovorax marinus]